MEILRFSQPKEEAVNVKWSAFISFVSWCSSIHLFMGHHEKWFRNRTNLLFIIPNDLKSIRIKRAKKDVTECRDCQPAKSLDCPHLFIRLLLLKRKARWYERRKNMKNSRTLYVCFPNKLQANKINFTPSGNIKFYVLFFIQFINILNTILSPQFIIHWLRRKEKRWIQEHLQYWVLLLCVTIGNGRLLFSRTSLEVEVNLMRWNKQFDTN